MDSNFFNRTKNDEFMKDLIVKGISNNHEVMKSEDEVTFEDSIKKGEVEVVTMEDIKDDYNNQFWKGEDVDAVEVNIEALIKKGEDEFLEEDEWDVLEKAMDDFKGLEQKAVAVQTTGGASYKRVYVRSNKND